MLRSIPSLLTEKQMKNNGNGLLMAFNILVITLWIAIGIWLFFYFQQPEYLTWKIGELGDYFGGGLGGIAVVGVTYTIWTQGRQLKDQDIQDTRATTLRIYELLKPEVENLAARIISRLRSNPKIKEPFDEMLEKFKGGDRTVFLRAMQKIDFREVLKESKGDLKREKVEELDKAVGRFDDILGLFHKELEISSSKKDEGFAKAMKQTEIYATYRACKEKTPN
jgi:hypothetical protein